MKKLLLILTLINANLTVTIGQLQQSAVLFDQNRLIIKYDINKNNYNYYYVWPEIARANGEKIYARSLSGDYGLIKGGSFPLQIIWDLGKDSIFLDENISVQLKAEVLPRLFSKPVEMGRSVLFPGWGLSRIHRGKPYWLIGIAGYGCVAVSVILNRQASQNYRSYLESDIKQESDRLFMQATQQDRLSESLAWTAAGIWFVNLLWVAVTPNHPKPSVDTKKWSLAPAVTVYRQPVIALKYEF